MVKSGLQGMTVNGVKKRSYWKFNESMNDWVECPNLPVSYEDVYLERGFHKSPPEKKTEQQPAKVSATSEKGVTIDRAL